MAGDICAAVGLKTISTGDTICDEEHPIMLEKIDFPTPVIQLAVEPKTKADQEKMGMAIREAGAGRSDVPRGDRSGNRTDDSVRHGRTAPRNHRRPHDARIRRGGERRQAAGGLSRNHSRHGGSTITRTRSRRAAAASMRARKLRVEPNPGKGFEFVNEIKGGNIPKEFIPAIRKGRCRSARRRHSWPAIRWKM